MMFNCLTCGLNCLLKLLAMYDRKEEMANVS